MSTAYYDPTGANAIGSAVGWLQGTLLGTVATTVAVIAVAWIGLLMFSGRIDIRRSAQVIFGCFVIFGASTIAAGIMTATGAASGGQDLTAFDGPEPHSAPPPQAYPQVPAQPYDPYAGAAVPANR